MEIQIHTAEDLGTAIRQVRRHAGSRQDDVAAVIGVSHVTLGQIERGHAGAAIGTVLAVMAELGIRLYLDVPEQKLKTTAPRKSRKRAPASP